MSRKRIKQYLMLLTAVGLIAVAANGSGTFASFTAQITNGGNQFTTGTLLLHETNGTTTCASESGANNVNASCTMTFNVDVTGAVATATLSGSGVVIANGASVSSLPVTGLSADVSKGETVTVGNDNFIASAAASAGDSSISVLAQHATEDHSGGDAVKADPSLTHYMTLTLTNDGTVDANHINLSGSCDTTGHPVSLSFGTATPGSYDSTNTRTPVTIAAATYGAPSGASVTIGSTAETLAQAINPNDTTVYVTGDASAVSAGTLTYAPSFSGTGATSTTSLCSSDIGVTETDNTWAHDATSKALGCAYGSGVDSTTKVCQYGDTLSGLTTPQDLTLSTASGTHTLTGLDGGASRYLLIGVQPPTIGDNGDQNKLATFSLTWKLTQA